uniref:Anaphasepromoting complex subunit putative n=1 Tax=Albugo laibachii Nc14 TaxID=890382 RepID=F0W369_9STRA|nr:anaphasepromoting complex subunit putative [Albugo laibachii Nc14]|eukprot:CCA15509.1 anaphasepromoting complex subunit putative [Albugo laibachii Nc14]
MNLVIIALKDRIQACIDSFLLDDAIFFAERLVCYRPSEDNLYILATCYHRVGDLNNAIAILQECKNPDSLFMLALCYFQQNKTNEAADALTGVAKSGKYEVYGENIIKGAAGLNLMGKIYRQNNQRDKAIKYFVESLELDPLLWSSYQNLCEMGANMEASNFYGQRSYFDADQSIIGGISSSMMTPQKGFRQKASGFRACTTPTSQSVNASQSSNPKTPRGILSTRTPSSVKKKARIASTYTHYNPSTSRKRNETADTAEKLPRRARLSFSSAMSGDNTPVIYIV